MSPGVWTQVAQRLSAPLEALLPEAEGHRRCDPGARAGVLASCWQQLLPQRPAFSMGASLVNCLSPLSPGLQGPSAGGPGGQGEPCACLEGHCVEHGVVGDTGNDTPSLLCSRLSCSALGLGLGDVRRSLFSPRSALLHLTCSLPLSPIIVCPPWLGACDRWPLHHPPRLPPAPAPTPGLLRPPPPPDSSTAAGEPRV